MNEPAGRTRSAATAETAGANGRPGPGDGTGAESAGETAPALHDQLPYRIVRPYRVRFEEATADETLRTAVFLAWLADIAWQHSTDLGFGRDWYSSKGLFWLVRAIRLDVLASIATYASVLVSTQVLGYRRVAARRESEVRDLAGNLCARAEIDWVMTNDRGVPTRVPVDFRAFVAIERPPFEMHRVALPPAPFDAFERRFRVRRRDLDPLDHVNNSVYVDYLEDALRAAGRQDLLTRVPRRYELDFAASAAYDEPLVGRAWPDGGGLAYTLRREDGAELFRARVSQL